MKPRRNFNATERQAILILRVLELEGRPIPRAAQKKLTAKEICAWVDADHYPIRHTDGGTTHPSNGQMLINQKGQLAINRLVRNVSRETIDEHGSKTAKRDIPEIAKGKRVIAANQRHAERMAAKGIGDVAEKLFQEFMQGGAKAQRAVDRTIARLERKSRWPKGRKIPSRPFQKGHRPLRRTK